MSDLNIFEIWTFILEPKVRCDSEPQDSEFAWETPLDIPQWCQGVWKWLQDRNIPSEVQFLGHYSDDREHDHEVVRVFIEGQDKAAFFKLMWSDYIHPFITPEDAVWASHDEEDFWDIEVLPFSERDGSLVRADEIVV